MKHKFKGLVAKIATWGGGGGGFYTLNANALRKEEDEGQRW